MLAELDGKLAQSSCPFRPSPPTQTGIPDGEIEQLQRGIIVGQAATRFDDLGKDRWSASTVFVV
jgi:hypothetical protein